MTDRFIRVALAGVGSCASSFVQATVLSRDSGPRMAGVMHEHIGGYRLGDVEFVAAFDVDGNKVGQDLAEAIAVAPTAALNHVPVPLTGVRVRPGPLLDGLDGNLSEMVRPHPDCASLTEADVTASLRQSRAQVLVCFLPTGSTAAVQAYARASAEAGVAFVNATPEPVANRAELVELFVSRGVPLLGDDLRSHLGATTLHTALLELLQSRGMHVANTYQLNVGGNMDFYNLADPTRSRSKQISKRRALTSAGIDSDDVAAGPNGYVKYLGDRKVCFLRIEAEGILGTPLSMEIRLEVEDSPNAASVVANAVRIARTAADQGLVGVVDPVCPFLFKSPPAGLPESEALRSFQHFVEKSARPATAYTGAARS
ncbi:MULTISPECIES: inositol-3-phosphate synthase [Streptomyces]|uniref:Inositol-3-phosphate synthase n=1 Tax=Streptomyces caniscabiei TaxID=2746961 RepID=A0ABU4N097_9ACTN|nr:MULTISPECIES: myo-inositol-1-phosphate synthase [Streptomyces]MBE4741312.1 myo-inositol-1-phosphate synthase [Streptomyces caniscabiei]MBE4760963.1 myo-inositol-1-phosphate synthase [Streptomyces caniscabiei]MBE4774880.1 myo-inositol-1-phosphate synthase [Streptomyces caniscabiei]MBE4789638.1 myo-inositol-1-phosphate synthase [Streptomyces caniscabiei]MBE4798821.1 myo-inositol-1-phosphate synthase [Streptomyces caniscabiei]